jgi:hypothetical protein
MEMTFPFKNHDATGEPGRATIRALISSSVSRQVTSPTAAAVMLQRQNTGPRIVRDDSMAGRARYFAGAVSNAATVTVPHGAFFSGTPGATVHSANYDQAVYQDGSTIGKPDTVEVSGSEKLAANWGRKN